MLLYHGTCSNLRQRISTEGLLPKTYLTNNIEYAKRMHRRNDHTLDVWVVDLSPDKADSAFPEDPVDNTWAYQYTHFIPAKLALTNITETRQIYGKCNCEKD